MADTSLQQSPQLDKLFNTCLQRNFPNQEIAQVRRSCSRLANLCTYSGTTFVASKHWLGEFKERQDALNKKAHAKKDAKKQDKKEKKKAKKAAKKAKKGKKGKKLSKEQKKQEKEQKAQQKKQKKEQKKQKKQAKEAEKKAKKEAEKNMSDEEKKAAKAEKKKAKKDKKKAKKEKKKEAKKGKKAKKFQKKAGKVGKKLLKDEDKLEKKQQKIAKKLAGLMDKSSESADYSSKPADVEKRLAVIRDALKRRDNSISRYATCLAFVNEDKAKDAIDAQCVALKKASESAFKAEQCWARYLDVITQCKAQSKKKACYKSLGSLDSVCGELDAQSRTHLKSVFKESAQLK